MARNTSREGQLRIEQRVGEKPDIWALRAFTMALPYMDAKAVHAFSIYVRQKCRADRAKKIRSVARGKA